MFLFKQTHTKATLPSNGLKQLLLVARRDALGSLLQHGRCTHISLLLLLVNTPSHPHKSMILLLVDVVQRIALEGDDLTLLLLLFLLLTPQELPTPHTSSLPSRVIVDVYRPPLSLAHRDLVLVRHRDGERIVLRGMKSPLSHMSVDEATALATDQNEALDARKVG